MAGALVDVLLERLATLARDEVEQELKLVVGVKQELQNLTLKLEAIRAVLEDAEQKQVMEASVKLWLNQLNDVSFDLDDVLDEWITKVLKHQLEKQIGNALVTTFKKVCNPSSSQLFLRHEIATKIKELNERLASIDERKQSFGFQNCVRAVPELLQRRKTTSLPNVKTFGRDNEKNLIISKLLSESSEGNEVPLIIPIVGMGGMGKTSLANLVYNDDKIKSHFDKSIWVCVSDPFEDIKIAKAIIEGLDKDNTSKYSNELETLLQCIFESVEGKKFLLVLDDVWSPDSHQWEELIKPLCTGAIGSRVLVTTRKKAVVTLMKATTQIIPLRELGEPFCLSLFFYNADVDESSVSREFHDIGLAIVKRCKGLPLAAKTLGSLMRNKEKIEEWRAILNSKTWELKNIQHDVFQPLLLSYHDLDPAVKRCLLYCVVFPKDYVYDKTTLIEVWMSQDYLNVKGSQENMIVGQNYFDNLVKRSFFQDVEVNYWSGNITCKIHDIVHDFLQYLTKNEYLILGDVEIKEVSNDKVHHVTIEDATDSSDLVSFDSFLLKCTNLRSLIVLRWSKFVCRIFESIAQFKSLRTITCCGDGQIPKKIGRLIHLRYLDLSGNKEVEKLSDSIGSLYNLQTLKLVGCWGLTKIDVRRLINLRHVYVGGCVSLRLILGIAKLRHLRRLDWFIVPYGEEEGNKLEDLKDLNQLQGSLHILIEGDANMAKNAGILANKRHLEQLSLTIGSQEEIMNGLEPHPGLESLSILGYKGAFSDWLSSLHSLRMITLTECPNCKMLPPLGKLASLKYLCIDDLPGVSKVGVEFLGIEQGETTSSSLSSIFISFPNLKQLTIKSMPSWEEWEGVEEDNFENMTIMPCLSLLTIYNCAKLKALPDFLWNTLQRLEIVCCPILEDLYRQGIGEEWVKISHIPTIKLIS
ncbi:PREDICTED: putative disease resistance protein RGA3-like isoform 3 [Fragaria vesca subsp. vesca]|uniref:putative disease resistance protein RGA3 n=1 Tax=Fragaria vesca subsp. vesca TaxID=101020 RepID=UPI0002C33DB1|nr:PREDICTED: putative disease resistance protein RGA3 [Fragaria vesca subsp. vesca]